MAVEARRPRPSLGAQSLTLIDTVLTLQQYWPYGAQRTPAGQTPPSQVQTDKQYTGQQTELGDSALGRGGGP